MSFWNKKEEDNSAKGIVTRVEQKLADYNFREQDWEEARIGCEKALEMDPNYHPAYIILGAYYQQKGLLDKMDEYFYKGLKVSGPELDEYTWDWVIVTLDDGMKDYERLIKYMEKAMLKEPDNFGMRKYLVNTLWKKLNRFDDGIKVIVDYIKTHPDDKKAVKFKEKMLKKYHSR